MFFLKAQFSLKLLVLSDQQLQNWKWSVYNKAANHHSCDLLIVSELINQQRLKQQLFWYSVIFQAKIPNMFLYQLLKL